jgi:hypothetical protein
MVLTKPELIGSLKHVCDAFGGMSGADFRAEIEMFGNKTTRGAFIVNLVLGGCAAYRSQLFLYLKACGREELSTMNLWGGMDAPAATV